MSAEPGARGGTSREPSSLRATLVTVFPMFIATLSLLTSIYNGYLNSRFVDLIQGNIGRVEYLKTCKEAIDGYFQVKLRTEALIAASNGAEPPARETFEARSAVSRFAALGTYLANLRNETVRERYTALTGELEAIVGKAHGAPKATATGPLFERADGMFSEMNDDCVKSAKAAPLQ